MHFVGFYATRNWLIAISWFSILIRWTFFATAAAAVALIRIKTVDVLITCSRIQCQHSIRQFVLMNESRWLMACQMSCFSSTAFFLSFAWNADSTPFPFGWDGGHIPWWMEGRRIPFVGLNAAEQHKIFALIRMQCDFDGSSLDLMCCVHFSL